MVQEELPRRLFGRLKLLFDEGKNKVLGMSDVQMLLSNIHNEFH